MNFYTDPNRKEEWRAGWRGAVDQVLGAIVKTDSHTIIYPTLEEAQLVAEALPIEVSCAGIIREPNDGGWGYTIRDHYSNQDNDFMTDYSATWLWDRPPIGWSKPQPNKYIWSSPSSFPTGIGGIGRNTYNTLREAIEVAEKYGPDFVSGITQDHYGSRKFSLRFGRLYPQTDPRKKESVSWVYEFETAPVTHADQKTRENWSGPKIMKYIVDLTEVYAGHSPFPTYDTLEDAQLAAESLSSDVLCAGITKERSSTHCLQHWKYTLRKGTGGVLKDSKQTNPGVSWIWDRPKEPILPPGWKIAKDESGSTHYIRGNYCQSTHPCLSSSVDELLDRMDRLEERMKSVEFLAINGMGE